jgi:hypothetical protein
MMITAANRDKGRNQMKCIEKRKPKNQNMIRQHEKNKPIFQYHLSFFLIILLSIHPPPPKPLSHIGGGECPFPLSPLQR